MKDSEKLELLDELQVLQSQCKEIKNLNSSTDLERSTFKELQEIFSPYGYPRNYDALNDYLSSRITFSSARLYKISDDFTLLAKCQLKRENTKKEYESWKSRITEIKNSLCIE